MSFLALHVEDEKDWQKEIQSELSQINGFNAKIHLRSVNTISELKRILSFYKGNLILIMDLRHGNENPNFDGFHWMIEELPNFVDRNPSISIYVLTGRLKGNDIAREAILRLRVPETHIFDKASWYKESDKFIKLVENDIEHIHELSLSNLSRGISNTGIDPFLVHGFDALKKEDDNANSSEEYENHLLPMLIRAKNKTWDYRNIPDIQVISQINNIYGCIGSLKSLVALEADPNVTSIESSRVISRPECDKSLPFVRCPEVHHDFDEKGDNSLIGIIDTGIDIKHEAFNDSSGKHSRIIAIWDQRDPTGPSPAKFGYNKSHQNQYDAGTLHTKDDIARYISSNNIPEYLDVGPDDHGTHVAGIAAGRLTPQFTGGIAPEAQIVVVIPRSDYSGTIKSLGYSLAYLSGLSFIKDFAEEANLPVAINVSHGMNAGAHDGSSLLEIAFDEITGKGTLPGIVIVKSAGNERDKNGHASFQVPEGVIESLRWYSEKNREERDEIELWFNPADEYRFCLIDPNGNESEWISSSNTYVPSSFRRGNNYYMTYNKFHYANGKSMLAISLEPGRLNYIKDGEWSLLIEGVTILSNDSIHAWVERRGDKVLRFLNHVNHEYTLSIPGTSHSVITVGSVSAERPAKLALYSSHGPTLDGRFKPDLCAPGENINSVQSGSKIKSRIDSGTSMSAPHVAGAIALSFSANKKLIDTNGSAQTQQLNGAQILSALQVSAQGYRSSWKNGIGYGIMDVRKLFEVLFHK